MIAVSRDYFLIISGNGDVIESDDNVMAIGSGGPYALAAARAMVRYSDLTATEIARESVKIASEICIYTNDQITVEEMDLEEEPGDDYLKDKEKRLTMSPDDLTPRKIVEKLDQYIIGQQEAKRAVAIALRNRWRRQNVSKELGEEISPKNIIMIGPTGVGKTEIARRLAKLDNSPFIKVEASKFTEVGYVGRDVESMVRDLVELPISMVKSEEQEPRPGQGRGTGGGSASRHPPPAETGGEEGDGHDHRQRTGRRIEAEYVPEQDTTREKLRRLLHEGKSGRPVRRAGDQPRSGAGR